MHRRAFRFRNAVATLAAAAALAGCALPFGSFGANEPPDRDMDSEATVRDEEGGFLTGLFTRRPPDLPDAEPAPMREATLERAYGGVILRVTGVAPTQGWYNAALVAANEGALDAAGLMTVSLVAVRPDEPNAVGPERTRLLMAGAYLTDREIRDVRGFRVVAANQTVTLPLR